MTRQAYLILVDAPNETAPNKGNNKFYRMVDNGDGTFTSTYGRVGEGGQVRVYSIDLWDKKFREKIRKGYRDVTELQAVEKTDISIDHEDPLVLKLLNDLYASSHQRATRNYRLASFGSVTQSMLDKAQEIIDAIATIGETDIDVIRREFIRLYTIIPRQMAYVEDFLPKSFKDVSIFIQNEQETLESLRGQVVVAHTGEKTDILGAMGLTIKPVPALPKYLIDPSLRWRRGFEIEHSATSKAFEKYAGLNPKYLYHGSRKANWLSILQTGLQIRPAANGTNFGRGIYFADDPQKSLQYTDGYMGIYEVAVGQQHRVNRPDSRLSLNNIQGDSVLADHYGYREYIIFRPEQCRIRYFLDVR